MVLVAVDGNRLEDLGISDLEKYLSLLVGPCRLEFECQQTSDCVDLPIAKTWGTIKGKQPQEQCPPGMVLVRVALGPPHDRKPLVCIQEDLKNSKGDLHQYLKSLRGPCQLVFETSVEQCGGDYHLGGDNTEHTVHHSTSITARQEFKFEPSDPDDHTEWCVKNHEGMHVPFQDYFSEVFQLKSPLVTDAVIEKYVKTHPDLEELDLRPFLNITSKAVHVALENCRQLELGLTLKVTLRLEDSWHFKSSSEPTVRSTQDRWVKQLHANDQWHTGSGDVWALDAAPTSQYRGPATVVGRGRSTGAKYVGQACEVIRNADSFFHLDSPSWHKELILGLGHFTVTFGDGKEDDFARNDLVVQQHCDEPLSEPDQACSDRAPDQDGFSLQAESFDDDVQALVIDIGSSTCRPETMPRVPCSLVSLAAPSTRRSWSAMTRRAPATARRRRAAGAG
jgi:hypothetical protein